MKVLCTADWHLGRRIKQISLLEQQKAVFDQIERIALEKNVDCVVIAGDIYDQANASAACYSAFKMMMQRLNLVDNLPVIVISGNHDSSARLGSFSEWTQANQLYIKTDLLTAAAPIEIGDTQFFAVPYFDAVTFAAKTAQKVRPLTEQMQTLVAKCQKHFKPNKAHVLVGHCNLLNFNHGEQRTTGNLTAIDSAVFAPFDFAVLGHIHQRLAFDDGVGKVFYCGNPMQFSLPERNLQKSVRIIDTVQKTSEIVPLSQPKPFQEVKGTLEELKVLARTNDYQNKMLFVRVLNPATVLNARSEVFAMFDDDTTQIVDVAFGNTKKLKQHLKDVAALASQKLKPQVYAKQQLQKTLGKSALTASRSALIDEIFAQINDSHREE